MTPTPPRNSRQSTGTATAPRPLLLIGAVFVVILVVACGALATWMIKTAPAVVSETPARASNDSTPQISLRLRNVGRDAQAENIRVTVDGESVQPQRLRLRSNRVIAVLPPMSEGKHDIAVEITHLGLFSRTVRANWKLAIDTVPPNVRVPRPHGTPEAPARSDVRSTAFTVRTEPHALVTITAGTNVARGKADDDGMARILAQLQEGEQSVLVAAHDAAGNVRYRRVPMTVDSIAPAARFHVPAVLTTQSWTGQASVSDASPTTLKFTADGLEKDQLSVDKTGRESWALGINDSLPEGNHRLQITALDSYGHSTVVARSTLVNSSEQLGENAISRGARGNDVRQLQQALSAKGFFSRRSAKGLKEWRASKYGPSTAAAVRSFQSSKGLEADGVAGNDTIAALTLRIEISRTTHTLTLYRLDKVERSYGVAVGSSDHPTPGGEFHILEMRENPTWTPPKESAWAKGLKPIPPGPDNPLGTRWMALGGAVGIHGTNNPASIGYSVSHGCIRMAIPDVEDLYDRVTVGTPVRIL